MIGIYFEDSLKGIAKTYILLGLCFWTPKISPQLPTLLQLNLVFNKNSPSDIFKICHCSAQNHSIASCLTKSKIQSLHCSLYYLISHKSLSHWSLLLCSSYFHFISVFVLFFFEVFTQSYFYYFYCIFSITIYPHYTSLPPITTLLSCQVLFSFLLNPFTL